MFTKFYEFYERIQIVNKNSRKKGRIDMGYFEEGRYIKKGFRDEEGNKNCKQNHLDFQNIRNCLQNVYRNFWGRYQQ